MRGRLEGMDGVLGLAEEEDGVGEWCWLDSNIVMPGLGHRVWR